MRARDTHSWLKNRIAHKSVLLQVDEPNGSRTRLLPRERAIMFHRLYQLSQNQPTNTIPFPVEAARILQGQHEILTSARQGATAVFGDRRMNVLARELGCLVNYEVDPDEPNAA